MALVVEDGNAKTDAQTYADVAYCDTYHSDLSNAAWAAVATEALKEAAILEAMQYLEGKYLNRWPGQKYSKEQALGWPRKGAVTVENWSIDTDEIPVELQKAVAELALRATVTAGTVNLEPDQTTGAIKAKAQAVGPLKQSITYENPRETTKYKWINTILAPIIGSASIVELERA